MLGNIQKKVMDLRRRHSVRYEDLMARNRDELLKDADALSKIDDKLYERALKKNRASVDNTSNKSRRY
ncbi:MULTISPECIES: FbpB family small basic protein [Shouchella]|uniref:FbpB family small basic protein n=3 Tax=Bacillaceae TaxID=186817 RepID=A0A060LR69_9BACI|nr:MULTISPECIES: FbpB family small basic protein [Bacillaceae]RQW22006.1 FbpB family small basic protein [Bacillus sp. C1-1]AIC93781.1 hypothetical protein BleG1_1178 [Shouchella lehensis G1]KQL59095.1 hypothetical protein AN965_00190 [Alkalicoccobacillus plakortidis]MBG9782543.1 hypothetical protein [Shouchella lehensis]TES47848.1 FbpB family small basic protein [Shouchella lehensis]